VPGRAGEVVWQGRRQQDWPVAAAAATRALMPQQAQDRFALTVERTLALSQVVVRADGPRVRELMSELDIATLAAAAPTSCRAASASASRWRNAPCRAPR